MAKSKKNYKNTINEKNKKLYGKDEEILEKVKAQYVEGNIETDDENTIVDFQKAIFKKLLETNILLKNLNLNFAQTEEQKKMCTLSIENSEKALKLIDTIQNKEIILHYFNELQNKTGIYLITILSMISGTFSDDGLYKDDKEMTKIMKQQEK
jgi:hypothetical protein